MNSPPNRCTMFSRPTRPCIICKGVSNDQSNLSLHLVQLSRKDAEGILPVSVSSVWVKIACTTTYPCIVFEAARDTVCGFRTPPRFYDLDLVDAKLYLTPWPDVYLHQESGQSVSPSSTYEIKIVSTSGISDSSGCVYGC